MTDRECKISCLQGFSYFHYKKLLKGLLFMSIILVFCSPLFCKNFFFFFQVKINQFVFHSTVLMVSCTHDIGIPAQPRELYWNLTFYFSGLVLFIEEDHFLAEDFLHTLSIMQKTARQTCSQCNILSLGTYLKTYNYYADAKKVRKGT